MTVDRIVAENRKVEVELDDLLKLYYLVEILTLYFHQPGHYKTIEQLEEFLDRGPFERGTYKEMKYVLYELFPQMLPSDINEMIQGRED